MGQLKRLALGNTLTTWLGYHGYEGSGNNDAYDAKEVTWGWGANSDFGRLWRLCTAPDSNTRCQAANKDLAASGQVVDLRHAYDNGGNLTSHRDYLNSNQLQSFGYDHRDRLTTASTNAVGAGQYSHSYGYTTLGNMTSYAGGSSYNYTTWSGSCPTPLPTQAMPHAVKKIGSQYFCYDNNGNMTKRYDGSSTYTQSFNNENELTSVVVNGQTTTFTYDAAGIRVKTIEPGGSITHYYPFPGYEEEVNGATITRHTSYASAGQTVALRVRVVGGSNTLYYQHSDHLGSTVLLTNISGGAVANTTARYYPFGDWRTEPTAGLTDIGYTGHRHNNLGSAPDDIGLIYMNARWYLPGLGRFISADTIVPNPTNPQSWNRYTYTLNNPLRFSDPTGHCVVEDDLGGQCTPMPPLSPPSIPEQVQEGSNIYGIQFEADDGEAWTDGQMEAILTAARDIELRFRMEGNFAGYRLGQIWREIYGTVTMLRSSRTQYRGDDGELHDITYGAWTNGSVIEVYDTASTNLFNFGLNMVHEFGHRFNAVTENATDMSPYDELEVALGEEGVLNGLALRGGMPEPPYQQSIQTTPGELFADYYVNWVYRSFNSNPIGSKQYEWMTSQMPRWLGR
jgi:RHS repeat-associated protein